MNVKSSCCEKYRDKPKVCKRCPLMAGLGKKKRKRKLERLRKGSEKAA